MKTIIHSMSSAKSPTDKELMELGQKLEQFYNLGYINKKQAISFSFLKGLASGAGAFLGGTLIIALLLWGLSQFNQVPFAGHLVNEINQAIDKKSN
jgi:Domain of unknown function (DUF5665)